MSSSEPPAHIVIVGGGIIGCTTAYYLVNHPFGAATPPKVTLIEASKHGPAQGASGKAGGLVARWAYPKELVNVSYTEHERLAKEHNGKERWGWRYVGCGSWEGRAGLLPRGEGPTNTKSLEKTLGLSGGSEPPTREHKTRKLPEDLLWVNEVLTDAYAPMARDGETAQVHPYQFTMSMFELAKEKGLGYIHGVVTKVLKSDGKVTGIEYRDPTTNSSTTLSATHVVIAAGAWSPHIVDNLPISGLRAHSVTFRPPEHVQIAPYVLFTEITLPSTASSRRPKVVSPEIYARPDNEVYACGPGDDEPLPETVDEVAVDPAACDSIIQNVTSISEELAQSRVDARQACYLPVVSEEGGPIVGEAEKIAKGLYLATGHTCWGICNAPGTARALAELILDGKIRCANLRKLAPSVFIL
ncbi:hypothetical protein CC2G_014926 [Coprinopsis cinerea AmutBmut pab1-1]|nr:hypothetical protein CC2G_014926 [Coprinopsis cinerea AmutBmut pab1-1]